MPKPRNAPETGSPAKDESVPEPSGKTKKLKYVGPEGQVNLSVPGELIPGESYEVPEEQAEAILGSRFWEE